MQTTSKIILGIDPGTVVMGYGLILINDKSVCLLDMGVLRLSAKRDAYSKLELIHQTVKNIIQKHNPTTFAIEAPFFGKNVQSMLKLGRAQGVAIATAMSAGLEVSEYSPRKIKQSITGNGNADKEQVWKMLQHLLNLPEKKNRLFDASDAVAVAMCHHYSTTAAVPAIKKNGNTWEKFIRQFPDRVRK